MEYCLAMRRNDLKMIPNNMHESQKRNVKQRKPETEEYRQSLFLKVQK